MRTKIIAATTFAAILAVSFLIRPRETQRGTEIAAEIARLEMERPDLVCIGSSYVPAAINPKKMQKLTGIKTGLLWRGGAASACWYLFVKNVICAAPHKPALVLIYFQDAFLTVPTFRIDGTDRVNKLDRFSLPDEPLLGELAYRQKDGALLHAVERHWPLLRLRESVKDRVQSSVERLAVRPFLEADDNDVQKIFRDIFSDVDMDKELLSRRQLEEEDLAGLPSDCFDFHAWIDRSFLPPIIQLLRDHQVSLVLVRMKRRQQAAGIPESAELRAYMSDMRAYLERERVPLVDFSADPRIRLEHYAHGDHLRTQALFTPMLAAALRPYLPTPRGAVTGSPASPR